jgi:hypothetical protein
LNLSALFLDVYHDLYDSFLFLGEAWDLGVDFSLVEIDCLSHVLELVQALFVPTFDVEYLFPALLEKALVGLKRSQEKDRRDRQGVFGLRLVLFRLTKHVKVDVADCPYYLLVK